ncbi:AraC family transcriptional regulator [Mycobacterium asiaticum]|uniref:AraC family transcriptional regulator n=1 Tax=Mycobacterium asiaticum TaxID=1790 RepID=UPI0007EF2F6F|nr:AraC family transcriptional regulator [Mycobacterium asiaticum]OBI92027.1 AraC family transcriptional regulator [Mycobacterium asiaticum]
MSSLVRATAMRGYPELVRELGGDPLSYLSRFHIPAGIEQEEDAFIPTPAFARMIETTAVELKCPDFGLRLSRIRGLDAVGPVAVILRNCDTVLEAMQASARYSYAHTAGVKIRSARPTETEVRMIVEQVEPGVPYSLQAYEMSVGLMVRTNRILAGPQTPVTVSFVHDQLSSDAAYREALGCPVRFGQSWCGIELPSYVLQQRIDHADPEARRIAVKYLEATCLPSTAPLSERVAELARRLLPLGHCSGEVIADRLAVHPRTLQRRLATEGTSCQDVIDRERRTLAAQYLAEPRLRLGQIASLLGYTEQSALNRSCRRWFDKTPRECRQEWAGSAE